MTQTFIVKHFYTIVTLLSLINAFHLDSKSFHVL